MDPGALPPALAAQSLSRTAILLPLDAAIEALTLLTADGRCLENWEGWVRLPDGGRAKSLSHGGSFALPRDPAQAAERAREAMRRAQERWNRDPEYPGGTLYFGLTFADVAGKS